MKVSVIGLGFVGSAMFESFKQKGVTPLNGYDKFKKIGSPESSWPYLRHIKRVKQNTISLQ